MSEARKRILERVGKALGRDDAATSTGRVAKARNDAYGKSTPPRPKWSDSTMDRFLAKLDAAAATHEHVASIEGVGAAVDAYLRAQELPRAVRVAEHPLLQGAAWPDGLEVSIGAQHEGLLVSVSVADAAMAETGTLVLCSGPQSPTSLDFLADHHLVVLPADAVVPYMEDVWARLRERPDFPPRSLNYITGPSRTADIEQTIQLGAHGPRRLHVLLLQPAEAVGG
ncbi:MAG: LUD domain-containing protein [Ectothiorhodospiraceae bacterium]|nr:LUD domain-containing protein [Ectothiorhodospiraceae bacterium]MCH8505792.1 LUD domain-containing protein [Ectothiorhodospiraceae bacterium]